MVKTKLFICAAKIDNQEVMATSPLPAEINVAQLSGKFVVCEILVDASVSRYLTLATNTPKFYNYPRRQWRQPWVGQSVQSVYLNICMFVSGYVSAITQEQIEVGGSNLAKMSILTYPGHSFILGSKGQRSRS